MKPYVALHSPAKMRSMSDPELVSLLRRGSRAAFTEIYDRYWSLIYTHIYKMLGNEEDAKDVLQEVFSRLWLKSSEIREQTNLSGLLYISSRNRVLNLIEQNRVRNDYLAEIALFMTGSDAKIAESIDEERMVQIIEREIQNLPPKMRQIFELSRKESLSHKEIARRLNISPQTVKKQVQNALKLLKPKLNRAVISIAVLILSRI